MVVVWESLGVFLEGGGVEGAMAGGLVVGVTGRRAVEEGGGWGGMYAGGEW